MWNKKLRNIDTEGIRKMPSFHPPSLKRVNSLGLVFVNQKPTQDDVSAILFEKINVKLEDINVVQFLREKVIIKFYDHDKFQKVVDDKEGKILSLGFNSAVKVKVTNESSVFSFVSIRDCPPEMGDDVLINILSQYGTVEGIRHNRYNRGPFQGTFSGIRTAKMYVKKNIPSKITVNSFQIQLLYNGQRRTCFKCGSESQNHKKKLPVHKKMKEKDHQLLVN